MLVSQLEILAQIAHELDSDQLRKFVETELESDQNGTPFGDGIKSDIRQILKGGSSE